MMSLWFTATVRADYFAGTRENLLSGTGRPRYCFLADGSIAAGVVVLAISPLVSRLLHGLN